MQPIEILPDFFFIERGFLNGNHFAYRSDKSVLIDTAYSADADVTLQTLTELGIEIDKNRLDHQHALPLRSHRGEQDHPGPVGLRDCYPPIREAFHRHEKRLGDLVAVFQPGGRFLPVHAGLWKTAKPFS